MTPQYYDDDDLPFHLPQTDDEEDTDNIHKDDTEEVVIPEGGFGDDEAANSDVDDDVPFRLPYNDGPDTSPDAPIGSKFLTMPNPAAGQGEPTLPGSGGLDPNPDFMRVTVPMPSQSPQRPPPQQQRAHTGRPSAPSPAQQRPARPQPPIQQGKQGRPLPPRRRSKRWRPSTGCLAIFIGVFLTFCGGMFLIIFAGGVYGYLRVGALLNERIDEVETYAAFQSTFLYDRNGLELYEIFGEGRRTNVRLQDVPQALIHATIAIEDSSFYSNIGIDVGATLVALLKYVGAEPGEKTPGGSTITQQLVRNVLFDPAYRSERSTKRKIEEILLAIALTGRKSKDEILELYLNEIYYGNLAYGAQAAAHVFFGKDVGELTLGEAAMLAGLPQAPAELDPLNPDPTVQAAVEARWRWVLREMVEDEFITVEQQNQALREGLRFSSPDVPLNAPHFTVYARGQLEATMRELGYSPEEIARGGLRVYTTVDLRINELAQQVAREQVASLAGNNISNAAVIVIKPLTGEILAMVGSIDYNNVAIDGHVNVTTAFRQPGSAIKPFTYSAAMENGMTPGDVIWDTRTSIGIAGQQPYVPRNYDGGFHGPMIMRYALANSYNIPAVQTLRMMGDGGVPYLLDLLARFGVDSMGTDASRYGLSLTLGGGEISPLELTRAYAVLANQGALVNTTAILCILDNDNNILYEYEGGCPAGGNITRNTHVRSGLGTQVLDPRIAFLISDILADNGARTPAMGAGSALHTPGIVTSVKTGTTNDVKDNWTVGFTRNVAIGVWVGNNNGDPMVNTSGLTGAAPIWNRVITAIYQDNHLLSEFAVDGQLQPDQRQPPSGMTLRQICNVRLLQDPATNCPGTVTEWFLDSPAGLPDGQGGLYYPAASNPQQQQPPASGSYVQEYSPGVFRTAVVVLAPEVANAIQFNVPAGQRPPPAPRYCRVPVELMASPGVQEQLFIAPPPFPSDAAEAEEYARNHNLAFLPTIDCTPDLMSATVTADPFWEGATGGSFPPARFTAYVTSPSANQAVTGPTPIIGTADFPQDQVQYYVFEIIGGPYGEWTRIQEPHYNGVIDAQMETLYPPLQAGSYLLRLLLIDWNHNIVQQPHIVPFIVP